MSNTFLVPADTRVADGLPSGPAVTKGSNFFGKSPIGDLTHAEFRDCSFRNMTWDGALRRVRFVDCTFERVVWADRTLTEVTWESCNFSDSHWKNCLVEKAGFTGCETDGISFCQCQMTFPTLSDCRLHRTSFDRTILFQLVASNLASTDMCFRAGSACDVTWAGCTMRDLMIEDMALDRFACAQGLCEGIEVVRSTGACNRWVGCHMRGARFVDVRFATSAWSRCEWHTGEFAGCTLDDASFDDSRLEQIAFRATTGARVKFDGAELIDCSLQKLSLPQLSLRKALLRSTSLNELKAIGMDARSATLNAVDLRGANFSGANLLGQDRTVWADALLDGARFDEPAELQDEAWWRKHAPGQRMKEHQ